MDILKREELISLFDIYKGLLTDKQRTYFMDYYYSDLSLAEIAENYSVSRNAVFDMLKKTEAILLNYEECLHIHQKNEKILEIIEKSKSNALEEIKKVIEE